MATGTEHLALQDIGPKQTSLEVQCSSQEASLEQRYFVAFSPFAAHFAATNTSSFWPSSQCSAAFISPPYDSIAELTQEQIQAYMTFLASDIDDEKNDEYILPFKVQSDAPRISFKRAVERHIYRDPGQFTVRYDLVKKYGRDSSCVSWMTKPKGGWAQN